MRRAVDQKHIYKLEWPKHIGIGEPWSISVVCFSRCRRTLLKASSGSSRAACSLVNVTFPSDIQFLPPGFFTSNCLTTELPAAIFQLHASRSPCCALQLEPALKFSACGLLVYQRSARSIVHPACSALRSSLSTVDDGKTPRVKP